MICSRCGGDCRIAAGDPRPDAPPRPDDNNLEGYFTFVGCYGSLRYDFQEWRAVLCESCCEFVREIIDAGPGEGVKVTDRLAQLMP